MAKPPTSEHEVQAEDGSVWAVTLEWAVVNHRAECVRVTIAAHDEPAPVTSEVLRSLRIPTIVRNHRHEWAKLLGRDGPWRSHPGREAMHSAFSTGRGRALVGPKGERLSALEALQLVADIYLEAAATRHDPTVAVAEACGISHSAAAKRVARARNPKVGLLPPTTPGRIATKGSR